jgi:transposase, IS5 family
MYGANGINPRVAIGAIIIKHICDLSDRETILQIQENIYMQHFIGFSGFSDEAVFDPSLFVELRKRLGADQINEINESIMGLVKEAENKTAAQAYTKDDTESHPDTDIAKPVVADNPAAEPQTTPPEPLVKAVTLNEGSLIVDATACPQDIAYPTDLNLLNDAREQSQKLIDFLYRMAKLQDASIIKPRTYRKIARKEYLKVAQKKHKTKVEIRSALRKQLSYVNRNIKHIYRLLKHLKK